MPKYINKLSQPVYYGNVAFAPNQEVQTLDTLDTAAFIVGSVVETYNIIVATNDVLLIRFNEETAWTTVTLSPGAAQTAANIVADINFAYGAIVASDEGGKVRIDAPIVNSILNAIYIATVGMGSTAATTLGLPTAAVDPVDVVALQAFKISQNAEPYNITVNNNTFIFKVNNNQNWITAILTPVVGRTAAQIATDINTAYEEAIADANKIAFAVVPITIGGNVHIKLLAPSYNNFQSKLYIKSTGNTALSILGFIGDNFNPVAESLFPSLIKTSELPLYNHLVGETTLTFAGAGTKIHYLVNPNECRILKFIRATGIGNIFTCYIENVLNTPPFTIATGETFEFNLRNYRISKVIITAGAAGNLTIRELKD